MINDSCIENLRSFQEVIQELGNALYTSPLDVLSESTIGQHVRHVLEFYLCLLNNLDSGIVDYDARERDLVLQSDVQQALDTIADLTVRLDALRVNHPLTLVGDHGTDSPKPFHLDSNLQRELAFNLEHAIHHQAMIKIGLRQLGLSLTTSDFGVAPSTLRNLSTSS